MKRNVRRTRRRDPRAQIEINGKQAASIAVAMERHGLSRSTIYRLMKIGKVKGFKKMGRAYVDVSTLDDYVRRGAITEWHGRA